VASQHLVDGRLSTHDYTYSSLAADYLGGVLPDRSDCDLTPACKPGAPDCGVGAVLIGIPTFSCNWCDFASVVSELTLALVEVVCFVELWWPEPKDFDFS
jgi:hypothetical protein